VKSGEEWANAVVVDFADSTGIPIIIVR